DADDITIDSHLCFREGNGSLPVNGLPYPATITYADWASGLSKPPAASSWSVTCEAPLPALPNGLDFNCLVDVKFTVPTSGLAYVNIHLDYGVKGNQTDFNPTGDGADRYDKGTNTCVGDATYYDALQNDSNATPAGPVALATCTTYPFSNIGL